MPKKIDPPRKAAQARPANAPRSHVRVLAPILLLAALLRFYDLAAIPYGIYFDEAMNGVNALEAIEQGKWSIFYEENNGREGLFINIQAVFLLICRTFSADPDFFTPAQWMLRAPSAAFGAVTVLGLYLLTFAISGCRFMAGSSAFFLATSFWHINFSRIGFRAILGPLCLVFALWFLATGFRELPRRAGWWRLAAAGLVYGAGFHSYIAYRVTPLILLAALIFYFREFRDRRREFAAGVGIVFLTAALVVAPLAKYFFDHPASVAGRAAQLAVWEDPAPWKTLAFNLAAATLMFHVRGDPLARHNVPLRPQLFLPVGLLFAWGLFISVKRARERPVLHLLPVVWLGVALLPMLLATQPPPHALRSLLATPACFLLAALGAVELRALIERRMAPGRGVWIAAALAVVLIGEAYRTYFHTFPAHPEHREAFASGWREVADEVAAAPRDAVKYVAVPGERRDERNIPVQAYPFAVLAGAHSEAARTRRNIRFITTSEEKAAWEKAPGQYTWIVR